jgi:molybdopterin synthase sulfurtransferase
MVWKRIVVFVLVSAVPAMYAPVFAFAYNLMEPEDLKIRLDSSQTLILLDIQPENDYREHHFYGSLATFAYPVKTELETRNLEQAVSVYRETRLDIVIISPRGGRAAQRTHDFLIGSGVPEAQLFILKGGIRQWPYREMLLNTRLGCG